MRINLIFFFVIVLARLWGQGVSIDLLTTPWQCNKGTAQVRTNLKLDKDSVKFEWSNGQNQQVIGNLETGDYSVRVKYVYKQDTVYVKRDTTLRFSIEKKLCYVVVPKYFSPNDDNYNDKLFIQNTDAHPAFEFSVYNKWGQRVHHQQQTYEPWDGKWQGIDVPDGAYFYIFIYNKNNTAVYEKGDITILR